MGDKLRVLIVEDSKRDVTLLIRELKRGGYEPEWERVETPETFNQALKKGVWDIIISDYSLPKFSGIDAVRLLKESGIDLPFILVSGAIGEEIAAESFLAGAHDFIVKGKWKRFIPSIKRELKEAKVRQEKKLTENQLRYFERIASSSTDMMAILDKRFIYLAANIAYVKTFNKTPDELIGNTIAKVFGEEFFNSAIKPNAERCLAGEKVNYQEWFDFSGYEARYMDINYYPYYNDEDNKIEGFVVNVRDITDRKKAEKALRESEERFVLAAEGANDGLWDWPDITRDEEWWSPRWYELLGYKDGEVKASFSNFKAFLHPDDLDRASEAVRLHFGKRVPFDMEYRLITKSGEYRWFRVRGQALWDDSGNPTRMSGSIQDITDRKQTEKAIQKERDTAKQYFEVARVISVVLDNKGIVELINEKGCEVLGCKKKEIIGKDWIENFLPKRIKKEVKVVFEMLMKGKLQSVEYFENQVITKDGKERMIAWHNAVIKNESGHIIKILSSGEDITEKIRYQEEAIRAEQLASIGELSAGVAHEVNNPITTIINYSQILINKSEPGSMPHKMANIIVKEGRRIATIVRSLLSFSRNQRKEKSSCCIKEILSEILLLCRSQLNKEKIELKLEIPDTMPLIQANTNQIQQIFLNLINNARYALGQRVSGKHTNFIKVSCEKVNQAGRLFLRTNFYDSGIGISPDILDKVKEPFFTTKPSGIGTGLGLSICSRIIKDHGGEINIESKEGEFTKVILDLPVENSS